MAKRTIAFDNLVKEIRTTKGVTLLTGQTYPIGTLVVKQDTGKWTDANVVLSGVAASTPQMSYDQQEIGIVADDYDATSSDVAGVVYTGTFNLNTVILPGSQTYTQLAGILQAKDIILEDWSL